MDYTFSKRISALQPSAVSDILKATSAPGVIPFAAGNPDVAAFPIEEVQALSKRIFEENPVLALQYNLTEGYSPLREGIFNYMQKAYGIGKEFDRVLITNGSQQTMDLATKALCDFGDTIVAESPSFVGALNCFRSYGANLKGVPMESDGMDMNALEEILKNTPNVRFIYTIPNYQNPTGYTMSLEKRKQLYALALQYHVLILEDNPYGDLRAEGEPIASIKSMDTEGIVLYAGSFSKILAPGIRVAFVIAPEQIFQKLATGKQCTDVHTPIFNQMLVHEWMQTTDFTAHIEKIRSIYKRKLNLMCDLIDQELGDLVTYVRPTGGMFVWCALPQSVRMVDFCKTALEHGVAVVPGSAFLVEPQETTNSFRMNFTTPTDDAIREGMKRLGEVKYAL